MDILVKLPNDIFDFVCLPALVVVHGWDIACFGELLFDELNLAHIVDDVAFVIDEPPLVVDESLILIVLLAVLKHKYGVTILFVVEIAEALVGVKVEPFETIWQWQLAPVFSQELIPFEQGLEGVLGSDIACLFIDKVASLVDGVAVHVSISVSVKNVLFLQNVSTLVTLKVSYNFIIVEASLV